MFRGQTMSCNVWKNNQREQEILKPIEIIEAVCPLCLCSPRVIKCLAEPDKNVEWISHYWTIAFYILASTAALVYIMDRVKCVINKFRNDKAAVNKQQEDQEPQQKIDVISPTNSTTMSTIRNYDNKNDAIDDIEFIYEDIQPNQPAYDTPKPCYAVLHENNCNNTFHGPSYCPMSPTKRTYYNVPPPLAPKPQIK